MQDRLLHEKAEQELKERVRLAKEALKTAQSNFTQQGAIKMLENYSSHRYKRPLLSGFQGEQVLRTIEGKRSTRKKCRCGDGL